ncbi:MAG: hypothetical protein ABJZ69_16470 [Hyphomicrobiales bacterium]
MNDIAKIDQSIPQPKPALVTGGAIAGIVPSNIEEAFRLSDALHKSAMAPKDLDTTQKVMIAMISGMEVGLPPMAAVQSVAVINNRPCIWGDALIGIVRKSPLCTYVKEWVDGENDDMVAYCETLRKGESEPVLKTFSAKDAMRAGLWQTEKIVTRRGKGGSSYEKPNDSPWYKYPQRMLQMRARAWCLRDVYADVTKGRQVTEEVRDHQGPDNAKDVTPQKTALAQQLENKKAATLQQEASPELQAGFNAELIKEQTEAIQQASSGAQTEKPKSRPSQGDGEADPVSVSDAAETGSAEPQELFPYEIAKELIASLQSLKTPKAVSNTWKVQFEGRAAQLEQEDRIDIKTIVESYSKHLEGKLEKIALDNFIEDTLAGMSERIVQPADEKLS